MIKFLSQNLPGFGLDVVAVLLKLCSWAKRAGTVSRSLFEVLLGKGVVLNDEI